MYNVLQIRTFTWSGTCKIRKIRIKIPFKNEPKYYGINVERTKFSGIKKIPQSTADIISDYG